MSQIHVERVIGLLATDEAVRRRFIAEPQALLESLLEKGMELSLCERASLLRLDAAELERFARAVGPRLQRADLGRCAE